jgi:electron transfer flavoprotein alpha subunit
MSSSRLASPAKATSGVYCSNVSAIHVLVAGHNCNAAVEAAAKISGVSKVLVADAVQFANGLAENVSEQALALALTGSS